MEIYLKPIISACYVFPILALLFTLPYILYEYHKYGSLLVLRTGIVYTFIFYMLTSYFMTVLPLPPIDSVTPDSACVLLVPFDAVRRMVASADVIWTNPATYINLFKCSDFWQIAFNILLLLPFGVYLRYYFKRPWWQVLILSFGYSLFFELTQLSGLYGIYKYPYRFFEVDDLICNTLGGMVGYAITPLLVFMLPKRERLDEIAYNRGQIVSEFRRIIAWTLDMVLIMIPVVIYFVIDKEKLQNAIYDVRNLIVIDVYITCVYTLVTAISKDKTFGKSLVNIKLVRTDDKRNISPVRLFIRYAILYIISLPAPVYAYNCYHLAIKTDGILSFACIAGCIVSLLIVVYFAIDFLLCLFSSKRNMLYDRLTGITHISIITSKMSR